MPRRGLGEGVDGVVGVDAGLGDFTLKANYGRFNSDLGSVGDFDQYSVSADTSFGATTVTAFYKDTDIDGSDANYGLGAAYDLGAAGYIVKNNSEPDFADVVRLLRDYWRAVALPTE